MGKNGTLCVNNISYSYPEFDLKKVSFDIGKGEIVGFIGKNGAGKTTTIKCITGQLLPTEGTSRILNDSLNDNPAKYKSHFAYVCEDTSIYDSLTPLQFVNAFKKFYSKWDEDRYRTLFTLFNLNPKKKLSEHSKGMKMKFHLAFALSHNAQVLILDEPTSGLDPFVRSEFLEILSKEAQGGKSVLFSTHITEDIYKAATRILFISNGEIKFDLPVKEIHNSCFCVDINDYSQFSAVPHRILKTSVHQYVIWLDCSLVPSDLLTNQCLRPLSFDAVLDELNND